MRKPIKITITIMLVFCFFVYGFSGCAKKEEPVKIDLDGQRQEFILTANNHLVDQPDGITPETTLVTEGNYLISADCPVVAVNEIISQDLRAYVEKEVSSFRTEAEAMGAPSENTGLFSLSLTYKPYPVGTELLSIKFTQSAYSGKTDKKNYIESFVYDIANSKRMGIEDVFNIDSPNYLASISDTVRQYLLENEIVRKNLNEDLFAAGTAANAQNFSNFAITPDSKILFFFNKDTVAPAETGTLEVCIPLAEFGSILNPANKELLFGKTVERQVPIGAEDAEQDGQQDAEPTITTVDMSAYPQFFLGDDFMELMPLAGIDPLNDKVIALTFDDGPAPSTPDLLDVLKENNALATFFVVGDRIENFKDIFKRTYDEGHEIANHSWDHSYMTDLSLDQILNGQYGKTNDVVQEITGKRTIIDRPPGGKMTEDLAQQIGREQVLWTVDTEDWRVKNEPDGADIVYNRIMDGAKDGAIILMHDLHEKSVQGAIRAIPELIGQGYKLVTVTQMLQIAEARGQEITYLWGSNTVSLPDPADTPDEQSEGTQTNEPDSSSSPAPNEE